MNVANQIISEVLQYGGIDKYLGLPDNPLFVGLDKNAWHWIKKHHANHGVTPALELFRENFPEVTYKLVSDGRYDGSTNELLEEANRKIDVYSLADTLNKAISFHDSGNLDQAVEVMRSYAASRDERATGTFRVIDADDLEDLPDPEFLVENLIQAGTVNQLTGFWGTGKSFLALDWACCVATGKDWFDRPVQQGSVVYVAAEGGAGIKKRVRSWKNRYDYDSVPGLKIVLQPVQLADSNQLAELVALVKKQGASMVVIDTQAQCTIGLEENSTQAMGQFIQGLYALRDAVAAESTTVMVIHHTGYEKTRGRGTSSVAAGMDGILNVTADDPTTCMKIDHQKAKDFAKQDDIYLKLEGLGASQVIAASDNPGPDEEKGWLRTQVLTAVENTPGITSKQLQELTKQSQPTISRVLQPLEDANLIRREKDGKTYRYYSIHMNSIHE